MQHGLHAAVVKRGVGYHHGAPLAVPAGVSSGVPCYVAEQRSPSNHSVKPVTQFRTFVASYPACTHLEIKLTAAVAVRGGKNSSEKNGCSFFIFRKIFCTSDSGDLVGEVEREEVRDEFIEDEEDVLELLWLSAEAGNEG